ncbi:MAG: CBS domain-containing protein [Neisseriaceae bacterium]|nr:CBS domain-containing protein [Neisseriaceae bacterium]
MDESLNSKNPGFFERLKNRLTSDGPDTHEEVVNTLRAAFAQEVLDADTLNMLESVLAFGELEVRDVMLSRSQMDVIREDEAIERIVAMTIETAHSRFPVIGADKDHVLGIVHAKDLLRYFAHPEGFKLHDILREAVFVPESQSLSTLLKDFRSNRNHMALVVDEYGGVSGLVTIEDVIEQIIGEIEDEFDEDDTDNIIKVSPVRFLVKATIEVDDFNEFFQTDFSDEEADTLAGLVTQALGRLPERGESLTLGNMRCTIARADARRLQSIMITLPSPYSGPQ